VGRPARQAGTESGVCLRNWDARSSRLRQIPCTIALGRKSAGPVRPRVQIYAGQNREELC
jgi:hypothetical protein